MLIDVDGWEFTIKFAKIEFMEKKPRVICAMSGGVDSSVTAAILQQQGFEVIGIFMKLWSEKAAPSSKIRENICCSAEAAAAARAVANKLKIPFYVINLEKEFKRAVVDYYLKEYEAGRTPNPCVICNRDIKGEFLLKKVLELKADFLATGHYARISLAYDTKTRVQRPSESLTLNSRPRSSPIAIGETLPARPANGFLSHKLALFEAQDRNKDQSYFLWALSQKHLSKILFPVGSFRKKEVIKMAQNWHLPTAQRRESQGICFIPDREISQFLRRQTKKLTKPGPIYDISGKKLGLHQGLLGITIGQRHHLGVGGPKAYYVVKLNIEDNSLIVGDEEDLYRRKLIADNLNWIGMADSSQLTANGIGGRIRYGHPIESCKLKAVSRKQIKVIFDEPQRAITPGQSIVFYRRKIASSKGAEILGGGIIKEAIENSH